MDDTDQKNGFFENFFLTRLAISWQWKLIIAGCFRIQRYPKIGMIVVNTMHESQMKYVRELEHNHMINYQRFNYLFIFFRSWNMRNFPLDSFGMEKFFI